MKLAMVISVITCMCTTMMCIIFASNIGSNNISSLLQWMCVCIGTSGILNFACYDKDNSFAVALCLWMCVCMLASRVVGLL